MRPQGGLDELHPRRSGLTGQGEALPLTHTTLFSSHAQSHFTPMESPVSRSEAALGTRALRRWAYHPIRELRNCFFPLPDKPAARLLHEDASAEQEGAFLFLKRRT